MAASPAARARRATSAGAYSPSEAVEWQCRSTRAVRALRRRPRRLGLVEQLPEVAVRHLHERRIRAAIPDGRVPREPAPPVGPRALLEHQAELIPPVHGDAS